MSLHGLMQFHHLLIPSLLEHAAREHASAQIVSLNAAAPAHRCSYADVDRRARQLAQALTALGVRQGDRVGTMAWNHHRHLELFFGVSGMGAVLHTVNPRLFPEQLAYILNHAEDQVLCVDPVFVPLVASLRPQLPLLRHVVVLAGPEGVPPDALCCETLLAEQDGDYRWPELDERTASSLCYTSGTTGHPKGVLYSHRSTLLHAQALCYADSIALRAVDTLFMASPMFHVNAWGTPYACALTGASMVLPGTALDGASIYAALRDEQVTVANGVPTVWLTLQQHVAAQGLRPREDLRLNRVLIGGAAVPRSVVETFAADYGTRVLHGWGMTETSPLVTLAVPSRTRPADTVETQVALQESQGRTVFGSQLRLVNDDDEPVPHDGRTSGRLLVRGHWIAAAYFRGEGGAITDADGWFDTGDIATIDADGYLRITDRAKDLIKSGGEWISSIALENAAVGHPSVAAAAVIAIPHPRWQERPLLLLVRRPAHAVTADEVLAFLAERVAKWWLPDEVVFVEALPYTATGKVQKVKLRELYAAPGARGAE